MQVIEQSLVAATAPVEAIEVPQSVKSSVSVVKATSTSFVLTAFLRVLSSGIVVTQLVAVANTRLVRHARGVHV